MTKQQKVADLLAEMIQASGKTQRRIAAEVGYTNPNVITMMKQGITKIPVEKAPALARALGADPAVFVRAVMREYMPEAWRALEEVLGPPLSPGERRLMEALRGLGNGPHLAIDEEVMRQLRTEVAAVDNQSLAISPSGFSLKRG